MGELLAQRPRGSPGALLVAGDDGEVLAAGVELVDAGAESARDDLGGRASDALAAACARARPSSKRTAQPWMESAFRALVPCEWLDICDWAHAGARA